MKTDYLSKEHEILVTMRKVLSSIVRDTTPPAGRPNPLRPSTIDDVKQCFMLISAREKEIHEENGTSMNERPRYPDQPKKSQVVQFSRKDD